MIGLRQTGFQWHGQQVQDAIGRRIHEQMLRLGNRVVSKAQALAPKRTGRLSMSIYFDYNAADFRLVFVVEAPYGMFVEFGTRFMRPHPYLRPALNSVGEIFGYATEFAFANVPAIHAPILTRGAGFMLPSNLTKRQLAHVRKRLLPVSKRLYKGNVSRAGVHIRSYR